MSKKSWRSSVPVAREEDVLAVISALHDKGMTPIIYRQRFTHQPDRMIWHRPRQLKINESGTKVWAKVDNQKKLNRPGIGWLCALWYAKDLVKTIPGIFCYPRIYAVRPTKHISYFYLIMYTLNKEARNA